MKANMLFTSRSRSEGKPYVQRRRLTKTAATVNGEYDPDLALAIQESLKQAEIDALKAKENHENKVSEIECESQKENRLKNMANLSFDRLDETKQLKELVSVHMDLIQQQQDVINQKDKTIKGLKAENNALHCRIQRMERRMALLKQKEEMSAGSTLTHSPPPKPGTMSYTEPIVPLIPDKLAFKKKSDVILQPKRSGEQPRVRSSSITATDTSKSKRENFRKRKLQTQETSDSEKGSLTTSNLYHVSYYEPVSDEIEVEPRPDILRGAQSQLTVETPSFRIKTYTNLYVIEGTEDHEDETFLRRHQKPEVEEKRRKRWDDQRLREEKMMEKLREKSEVLEKRRNKLENPIDSFYPKLDEITHIEVMDEIPVSAFGHSIPSVKSENFSLPWNPKHHSTHRLRNK